MPRSRCNRECQAAGTESDRAVGRGARGRPLPRTNRVGAPTVSLSAPLVTVQPGQGRTMHRRHIGHTRTFCNSLPPRPRRDFLAPRAPAAPEPLPALEGPAPAVIVSRPSGFRERAPAVIGSAPQPLSGARPSRCRERAPAGACDELRRQASESERAASGALREGRYFQPRRRRRRCLLLRPASSMIHFIQVDRGALREAPCFQPRKHVA